MKEFNIDNKIIRIGGGIYCFDDVTFFPDPYSYNYYSYDCPRNDIMTYNLDIKGDLFIIGKLYLHCYPVLDPMTLIYNKNVSVYDENDFRIIKADTINMKCGDISIGKDITAFYNGFDKLRVLKLNIIKSFYVRHRYKNQTANS